MPRKRSLIDRLPSRYSPDAARRALGGRRLALAGMLILSLAVVGVVAMILHESLATPEAAHAAPDRSEVRAVLDSSVRLVREGRAAESRKLLEAAIARSPDDGDLYVALAESLIALNELDLAYGAFQQAIASGASDPATHFAAGTIASKTNRTDRAIEHYNQAQIGDPLNPAYPLFLAQVQIRSGLLEEAKASLLRSVHLDPDEPRAWGTLGELFLNENKSDLALKHLREARSLDPDFTRWRLGEAKALKRLGRPEEALDLILALDPARRRDDATLRLLGECFGMLRDPAAAAAVYADASDAEPANPALAYESALWFERAGDFPRAAAFARRAFGLNAPGARELLARVEDK